MYQKKRIGAILLMAGGGTRFDRQKPKQFHLLHKQPIYLHTLNKFLDCTYFDEIILVCHPDWIKDVKNSVPSNVTIIAGGATRQESSWLGLQHFCLPPDIVLIHDAVRPFVSQEIFKANLDTAIEKGAADTCIASTDTLIYAPGNRTISSIPNRSDYLRGQTPQTFRYDWIVEAHLRALEKGTENASDDCRLVLEAGYPVHIVAGSEYNLKITTLFDLYLADAILNAFNSAESLPSSRSYRFLDSSL